MLVSSSVMDTIINIIPQAEIAIITSGIKESIKAVYEY
jgi:hypothetical protein